MLTISSRRLLAVVGAVVLGAFVILSGAIYQSWVSIHERYRTWREVSVVQAASTAATFVGLHMDVLRILDGTPSDDPRAMLFDDPDQGILLVRLNNLHSQYQNLTNPQTTGSLKAQIEAVEILKSFLTTIEPEYQLIRGNGDPREVATALLPHLSAFRAIEERFMALAAEIQRLTGEREQDWRDALDQAFKVSIATFAALLFGALAGFALLVRYVRDRQIFEAQRDAQLARAEARAERGRTQEILDELPIAVRLIDSRGEAIYVNRALEERAWSDLTLAIPSPIALGSPESNRPTPALTNARDETTRADVDALDHGQHDQKQSAGSAKGRIRRTYVKSGDIYLEGVFKRLSDGSIVQAVYDVTDLVLAEERAIESRRVAEEAGRAKATFLANMSHEIRTPMNGVIGMLELLGLTRLDPDQRESIDRISEAVYSLLTIIDDILDFSKIEAGELLIESVEVSVRDLAESALDLVASKAEEKSVDLALFVDPGTPDVIVADPTRVRQIILNFLSNAVKFTEEGWVALRIDAIGGDSDPTKIRVEVKDTGIGIAEGQLSELFVAFKQAELSTTRRYGGTGLGLSICQRLVTKMGGEIGVESRYGEGSTFWFTLPLVRASTTLSDRTDTLDFSDNRVLVVSQSDITADMIDELLSARGATVERAASGREALAILDRPTGRPDALVFDARVPTLDFGAWRPLVKHGCDLPHGEGIRVYGLLDARPDNPTVETVARPVGRKQLCRALGVVLGKVSPEVEAVVELADPRMLAEPPSPEAARAAGQLILVAEDNEANRNLIRHQLNTLGYACEVAKDGREALDMWRQRRYGLLITDCNMPELDGYGLTAAIRAEEGNSSAHTPIVALTASALVGEAERCLKAGMDAYLSKPVRLRALHDAVRPYLDKTNADAAAHRDAPSAVESESKPASDQAAPIDHSLLRDLYGEDGFEMVDDLIDSFKESYRTLIGEMGSALAERNGKVLARAAHGAAGAAGAIGAVPVMQALQRLEKVAGDEEWKIATEAMTIVRQEGTRLFDELSSLAKE